MVGASTWASTLRSHCGEIAFVFPASCLPSSVACPLSPCLLSPFLLFPGHNRAMSENRKTEEHEVEGGNLMDKLKELIHEGNVTRVVIKNKEGRVLMDMPMTAGAVGVVLLPFWAGVAAIVGLAKEFTLTVERHEEPVGS